MAHDWYRNQRWTPEVERAFFDRLARGRSADSKAQHLRIQALYLQENGTKRDIRVAVLLLRMTLDTYPDCFDAEQTWLQLAECFDLLDMPEQAVEAYAAAFRVAKEDRLLITDGPLSFGEFCVRRSETTLFRAALRKLRRYEASSFPVNRFKKNALMALMLHELGENDKARSCKLRAMNAAGAKHSGFWKHPNLGLVGRKQKWLISKLERIR